MNPLISIVTPVYNRPELVQSTIESVLQQSYKNWEYILVDDNSIAGFTHKISGVVEFCQLRICIAYQRLWQCY